MKRNSVQWVPLHILLCFGLFFLLIVGRTQPILSLENAEISDQGHPHANEKILKGINLLYNLHFLEAENLFQQIIDESPGKPEGYFYLAMVSWSRMVYGYWSDKNVKEYKRRIDRTTWIANRRIRLNQASAEDYFYLGGALGFLGRFELMQKNWFSSFLVAKKAIKALKTCLEMDPDNRDVLLGLGTYDYYTAKLSGVLRFLTMFLLHKPDKNEGLRKLHIAAEEAIYSKTEAKNSLLVICLFLENDCSEALSLAKELGNKYDRDPLYKHFQGFAAIRMGLDEEYENVLFQMRQRSTLASFQKDTKLWTRRTIYLESVNDLFHERYVEARIKLTRVLDIQDPETDPAMSAWPLVKIGMAYDLEGDRKTAKRYYRRVIKLENGAGAQFMAEKCLSNPPTPKDPIIGY